jgi:hypothetical protein
MHSKVGLAKKTKGGRKKERKITNNEVYHICVKMRNNKTH